MIGGLPSPNPRGAAPADGRAPLRSLLVGLVALVAAGLGGCLPDTLTPLRATDGEPPPEDRGPPLDETVRDARALDGGEAIDGDAADTPRDTGADRGPDSGTPDTECDMRDCPDGGPDPARRSAAHDGSAP